MEEKLVKILNEMAEYLNISQMKKLQEVLLKNMQSLRKLQKQKAHRLQKSVRFFLLERSNNHCIGGGCVVQ